MTKNDQIELLVNLAKEVEMEDPIDWGMLSINEDDAYKLMATHILEKDMDHLIMKSIIVKLLVENFVLNTKLLQK
jgi:hypothetical protein